MACYDCEDCPKSIDNGGKCLRFEYDCPFVLIEKYIQNIDKIRAILVQISESVNALKDLDKDYFMDDEISSMQSQLLSLKEKTDKNIEAEWQKINELETKL